MKFICRIFFILLLFSTINPAFCVIKSNHGLDGFVHGEIDATKNARLHANMGNIYFDEKKYIQAIKEYEIAYNLDPKSRLAAAYLNNISRCFYVLENYKLAQNAIEGAIKKDCINITYYELLVDCYKKLGTQEYELRKHIRDNSNPYNRIIAGLIYLKTNRKRQAKIMFDDFITQNPDMIISDDVRAILSTLK